MSNSVQPHPWGSPGKNTGVGCHFLLQCIKVKSESEVAQSCPTVKNPLANTEDARDALLISGSGRSPGVGSGIPLQNSCQGNSMEREVWWATVPGVQRVGHNRAHMESCAVHDLYICWQPRYGIVRKEVFPSNFLGLAGLRINLQVMGEMQEN